MNNIIKEFVFSIVVKTNQGGELGYQINPELTIGADPRNDVVLTSPGMSTKHLLLKENNDELVLTLLGAEHTTKLNGQIIRPNENYILIPNDKIQIDHIAIKIKKELGIKRETKKDQIDNTKQDSGVENIIPLKIQDPNKSHATSELQKINLNFNYLETIQNEPKIATNGNKSNSSSKMTNSSELKIMKEAAFSFSYRRLLLLCLGLILDFFLAYFILSLVKEIKIHIFFFYLFLEVIFFFLFASPLGQKFLQIKFNRHFTFLPLILILLIYPLTRGAFVIPIKKSNLTISKNIDIHSKSIESNSIKSKLSLNSTLDSNLFLLPEVNKGKLNFSFYDSIQNATINLMLKNVYSIDHLNNYFYRTNIFRVPSKDKRDPLSLKAFYLNCILIDHQNDFKKIVITNGPFISFINDVKTFFVKNLISPIEIMVTPDLNPTIILRDKDKTNVYIIGEGKIYEFTYQRNGNSTQEELLIEKVLAKINANLINKKTNEIGFLEMLDSLPDIDYLVLLTLFSQESQQVRSQRTSEYKIDSEAKYDQGQMTYKKNLMAKLNNSIDQIIASLQLEIKKDQIKTINEESENTGPMLIKQFETIRNNFNKKNN